MIIDDYITVKIGDGELRFHNPEFRAWAVLTGLDEDEKDEKLPQEEKMRRFWENLAEAENLFRKSGEPVTAEDLKALKVPVPFYHQARKGLLKELTKLINGVGEDSKNE